MDTVLLVVSVVVNIISFLYIRWLLKSLGSINQDVETVYLMIKEYSNHLTSVHELEMFYGDETLGSLMAHTKDLSSSIEGLDLILNDDPKIEEGVE